MEILSKLYGIHGTLREVENLLGKGHPWKPGAGWPNNGVYDDLHEVQEWLNVLIETVEGLDNDDKTV